MNDVHDAAFFEQMRTCREPYRRLADVINEILGPQHALDIGCGIGLQTKRLKEHGWLIVGADHAPAAIELREPDVEIVPLDLTLGVHPDRDTSFNCVICTETAEHIPAEHADAIVENVVSRARHTIVWSAAGPGQDWPGHVNMQPPEYWLERFGKLCWRVDAFRSNALQDLMLRREAQHWMARQNFFIMVPV
jgi:SAM-dependent methyltransferase